MAKKLPKSRNLPIAQNGTNPLQPSDGAIQLCPHKGCAFTCCSFQQGNYIVLYPGEIDAAIEAGYSLDHLDIFDNDYHGGARARCRALNTVICDGGYKPLDCASYPYFPTVESGQKIVATLKGAKCPLEDKDITYHRDWTEIAWKQLVNKQPEVGLWLSKVQLVGYQPVTTEPSMNNVTNMGRSDAISRPIPYEPDLPSLVLGRWGHDATVEENLGSWENFVYRTRIEGKPYAMRITSVTRRQKETLTSELEWVKYLSQKGVSVCTPVESLKGELVETITNDNQTFFVSVFEWAEGRRLEPEDCYEASPELFVSWGRLLGRIHALSKEYVPATPAHRRPRWTDDVLVRKVDSLLEGVDSATAQICRELFEWANSLPVDAECFGLIHADLHGRNFRVASNGIVVFDFDDCCYCWFTYDLGSAINWAFPPDHAQRNQALTYMLEGYEDEFAISEEWRTRIPGMIRLRRVLNYLMIRHELLNARVSDQKLQARLLLFEQELLNTREVLF